MIAENDGDQRHLDADVAAERAPDPVRARRRRRGPAERRDQPPAVCGAERDQHAEQERLRQHDPAVAGVEERRDAARPRPRAWTRPGHRERDHRGEGDAREPRGRPADERAGARGGPSRAPPPARRTRASPGLRARAPSPSRGRRRPGTAAACGLCVRACPARAGETSSEAIGSITSAISSGLTGRFSDVPVSSVAPGLSVGMRPRARRPGGSRRAAPRRRRARSSASRSGCGRPPRARRRAALPRARCRPPRPPAAAARAGSRARRRRRRRRSGDRSRRLNDADACDPAPRSSPPHRPARAGRHDQSEEEQRADGQPDRAVAEPAIGPEDGRGDAARPRLDRAAAAAPRCSACRSRRPCRPRPDTSRRR